MKLDRNTMFAAAMILTSFAAVGCKTTEKSAPEAAPPAAVATEPQAAPVAQSPEQATVQAKTTVTTAAPIAAAPAPRYEDRGRAPSVRHQWQDGYWRYDMPRSQYAWVPGHWEDRSLYAPYAPPTPRFEDSGRAPSSEFIFVKGYWRWTGREYSWIPGHWAARRTGYDYLPSRWEKVNGRWVKRDGFWKASVQVEPKRADCDPPRHPKHKPIKTTVAAKVAVTLKS